MEITFRPLGVWPVAVTTGRKRSQFRAGYNDTLKLLDRELTHLRARHVVLQIALTEREIRRDGRPHANARPSHPGIVLSFESRHGPLSYPCDRYDDWEDNLRAIALAMEALRAVDRYGVTRTGEQYRGWAALPAPPKGMDESDAVRFLQAFLPRVIGSAEDARDAYRIAALKTHPDRGGDEGQFKKLQEAKQALSL